MGAPLSPWGASRGLPGGGSRPKVQGSEVGKPSWFSYRERPVILSQTARHGELQGSQMAPQGCGRTTQIGLGIVLVRSVFRLAVRVCFFGPLGRPKTTQEAPKTHFFGFWDAFLRFCSAGSTFSVEFHEFSGRRFATRNRPKRPCRWDWRMKRLANGAIKTTKSHRQVGVAGKNWPFLPQLQGFTTVFRTPRNRRIGKNYCFQDPLKITEFIVL